MSNLFRSGYNPNAHFFINHIAHHSCDRMHEEFAWDDLAACIRENRSKDMHVVFDAHTEAPGFSNLSLLVRRIRSGYGIGFNRMLLWGGGNGGHNCPIRVAQNLNAFSLVTDVSKLQPWPTPTHHFCMLSRMPKAHRIMATVDVLDRKLDDRGFITCGSAGSFYHNAAHLDLIPQHLRHRFPMMLDGEVEGHRQNDMMEMPEVVGSFCQLIPETSYELLHPGWSTIFPTEKSEKCLMMGQVPILLAPTGQVQHMRYLGFDMMDDLIDHSYDAELDPYVRITLVVDQLERICEIPLVILNKWRELNMHRLMANRDLCFKLRANFWEEASARFSHALGHGLP